MARESGVTALRELTDHGGRRVWFLYLATGLMVGALARARHTVDIDTWLHIRIGDALRAGERFERVPDPLVATADRGYLPTQWLSQELISAAHDLAGLHGVFAVRLLALMALVWCVTEVALLVTPPVCAAAAGLVCLVATCAAWAERPQLLGLALGALATLLWVRAGRSGRIPWLVVPLIWLWACVHGTWPVGVVMGICFAAAQLVARYERGRLLRLIAVAAMSVVAAAVTPLGPAVLSEPFRVGALARLIAPEWQRPTLANPMYVLVLVMAGVTIWRFRDRGRRGLAAILLAVAAAVLASYAVRTVAFAALLVLPVFAAALAPVAREARPKEPARHWAPRTLALLLVALTPGVLWGHPTDAPVTPKVAAELEKLQAGQVIAADLKVSNWVLYAAPGQRPLRDLRHEIYSRHVADEYDAFMAGRPGWREYGARHGVTVVLTRTGAGIEQALRDSSEWRRVVVDGGYSLWQARGS